MGDWVPVTSSSSVDIGAPKTPAKMTHNHTYTVYGTIAPVHTSATYMRYYAYRMKSSTSSTKVQTIKLSVKVKPSSSGSGCAYYASVKLPKAGTWKLRGEHLAHGTNPEEAHAWSAYSSKVTVK